MVSLNWQWGDLCRHERGLCHSRRQEFYSCRHHERGVQWFFPTYRWRNVPLVEHGQLMPLQFAFSQGWSSQSTTYPFTLLPRILLELRQVRKPSCKQQTVLKWSLTDLMKNRPPRKISFQHHRYVKFQESLRNSKYFKHKSLEIC